MNNDHRIKPLDSLRGIAALMVLFNHCYILSDHSKLQIDDTINNLGEPWSFLPNLLVKLLTAGSSAVILFFVLSGFVLTLSLLKHKISYKNFISKRFFRLYPVLLVAVISSYLLHCIISNGDSDQFSDWYKIFISPPVPPSLDKLFYHLVPLLLSNEHVYLDMPIWSLAYEIRISILFPFIAYLCINYNKAFLSLLLLAGAGMTYFVLDKMGLNVRNALQETLLSRFLLTGYFSLFFLLGISLALKYDAICDLVKNISQPIKLLLLLFAVLLLINPMQAVLFDYLCAVGAGILIVLAFSWKDFAKALNSPPLLWLGRVSYSLYFVHCIVIYTICELFAGILNIWSLIAIIITTSLLSAELMARFVEYPCIKLGKALLRKD